MRVEAFDDYIIRMDTVAAVYDRRRSRKLVHCRRS